MSATAETPFANSRFANSSLGEIATSLPGATAVLRRHKLDFCCGGSATLADAAWAKGLRLDLLEQELAAVAAAALPAEPAETTTAVPTTAVIDLILTRYHETHRRELPELARLARRVEAVHRDNPAVPRGLADLLETMGADLENHMAKEEQVLFPLMRQADLAGGSHPMIPHAIAMMTSEHDDHASHLRELERLTGDFTPPAEACNTWRALYAGGRKFADDLVAHIHTENNILFPRFA